MDSDVIIHSSTFFPQGEKKKKLGKLKMDLILAKQVNMMAYQLWFCFVPDFVNSK